MTNGDHFLDLEVSGELDLFAEELSSAEQMQLCCTACASTFATVSCVWTCAACYSTASTASCACPS